ncbi:MAG: hypothetical protein ACP5KE_01840 [Candidatus Methanodesulfokora sp.]|jgi:hypothetical protein|nr:MAG: hypothetical protein C0200_00320 [Candidatus Korarchaeota archaeon]
MPTTELRSNVNRISSAFLLAPAAFMVVASLLPISLARSETESASAVLVATTAALVLFFISQRYSRKMLLSEDVKSFIKNLIDGLILSTILIPLLGLFAAAYSTQPGAFLSYLPFVVVSYSSAGTMLKMASDKIDEIEKEKKITQI